MAQEVTTPSLLDRFSNTQLETRSPARIEERQEPVEVDRVDDRGIGRRPDEVVQPREVEPVATDDETGKLLRKRYKVRTGVDDGGEPVHEDLPLVEIAKRGLMEKMVSSANQLPNVARKYQDLLEKVAEPGKPAVVEAPKPAVPTQEQIYNHFLPMLKTAVEAGNIEPDFAEAYPQMATGLMYYRALVEDLSVKLGHALAWIQAEQGIREQRQTHELVYGTINKVIEEAERDKEPFFAGLKDPEKKEVFIEWLRKSVNPELKLVTVQNMKQWWVAHNAGDLLKFTKQAAEKIDKPTNKRAAGDGSGARPGKPESPQPKSMLDRMTDARLGEEA